MIQLWLYPLLFLTGMVAGFVDSIAGGGGLISLPVLLNIGLPPAEALGTNKLQATFGSASATWHYGRAGLIDFHRCGTGMFFTLVGATVGTLLVRKLPEEFLRQSIPWLLVVVAVYTLFRRKLGEVDGQPRMSTNAFYIMCGLALGCYDGFFGPGTGTFWAMAYLLFLGYNLTRATAHTKVMNFTSNLASLSIFAMSGHVHFPSGIAMGLGQLVGARIGSRVVIKRGTRFIRPIFITVVLGVTARLLYQNFLSGSSSRP